MLSHVDNELLTRTGPQTGMGQLMRRFWVPVLLSEELPEPDCAPKKIRIMGEDLLAFRDTEGKVGLVDPVCPHRGANLYYGRNEECGLRCAFHGWKFNTDGRCIDLPTAPDNASYKERIRIKAYPTQEAGDMIWAYFGPEDLKPDLAQMAFLQVPPSHRYVSKKWQDCNWFQCVEGAVDTAHFSFLHMLLGTENLSPEQTREKIKFAAMGAQAVRNDRFRWVRDDPAPRFTVQDFPSGLILGAARHADEDDLYWRITHFLVPNHALAPSAFPGENYHGQTFVPVDDTHCWIYTYTWNPERPLTDQEREMARQGHTVHAQVDEHYMPLRNLRNDYLLDRHDQKYNSYTGIRGVSEQDAAIQDSQGPIVDRTRENLGATDVGVVRTRSLMLRLAKQLAQGEEPPQVRSPQTYATHSGGWVAHESKPLQTVMQERFGDELGLQHRAA